MASRVGTYDPKFVKVTVNGVSVTGFSDATFIAISQISEGTSSKTGADGEIARAKSSDMRHSVTITLLQTSDTNDVFSTLLLLDQRTPGGKTFPITVSDLAGRTVFMAAQAWITKFPDAEYGQEVGDRAWVLHTGEPSIYNIGGNL